MIWPWDFMDAVEDSDTDDEEEDDPFWVGWPE